ncbi:CZB domain-containing protein [Hymenobacter lucidus]|uniref:CZB domain-containing protein n=1 Tax=Hymenobacter lucidus TaxID=2880930 RepID=A0ABS8AS31_9BACT|nr:CZB domain-containing protein [Hymenobacter lucidus]MCB2407511.1 CZB domain-containing protein [Hymenobacter lucidus]
MNTDLKQDFDTALTRHQQFKSRLRSFLNGTNLAEGPIRDPDQCSLGIWITEHRQSSMGNVPEWAELDRVHRQLHEEANRLMDMYLQGFSQQAREDLADLLPTIDRIPRLLQTIQTRLRTPR